MSQKELICIGCPMGCMLTIELEGKEIRKIRGNTCKNGESYARRELTDPRRIVTSTVRVEGGQLPVVPVKTKTAIPKEKIEECMRQIKEIYRKAPVHLGDVMLADVAGTGVAVIATKQNLSGMLEIDRNGVLDETKI